MKASRTDFGDGRKKDGTRFIEVMICHITRKTIPPTKDSRRYLSFSRFINIELYLFKVLRSESSIIELALVDFLISPSFSQRSPVLFINEDADDSEPSEKYFRLSS